MAAAGGRILSSELRHLRSLIVGHKFAEQFAVALDLLNNGGQGVLWPTLGGCS